MQILRLLRDFQFQGQSLPEKPYVRSHSFCSALPVPQFLGCYSLIIP